MILESMPNADQKPGTERDTVMIDPGLQSEMDSMQARAKEAAMNEHTRNLARAEDKTDAVHRAEVQASIARVQDQLEHGTLPPSKRPTLDDMKAGIRAKVAARVEANEQRVAAIKRSQMSPTEITNEYLTKTQDLLEKIDPELIPLATRTDLPGRLKLWWKTRNSLRLEDGSTVGDLMKEYKAKLVTLGQTTDKQWRMERAGGPLPADREEWQEDLKEQEKEMAASKEDHKIAEKWDLIDGIQSLHQGIQRKMAQREGTPDRIAITQQEVLDADLQALENRLNSVNPSLADLAIVGPGTKHWKELMRTHKDFVFENGTTLEEALAEYRSKLALQSNKAEKKWRRNKMFGNVPIDRTEWAADMDKMEQEIQADNTPEAKRARAQKEEEDLRAGLETLGAKNRAVEETLAAGDRMSEARVEPFRRRLEATQAYERHQYKLREEANKKWESSPLTHQDTEFAEYRDRVSLEHIKAMQARRRAEIDLEAVTTISLKEDDLIEIPPKPSFWARLAKLVSSEPKASAEEIMEDGPRALEQENPTAWEIGQSVMIQTSDGVWRQGKVAEELPDGNLEIHYEKPDEDPNLIYKGEVDSETLQDMQAEFKEQNHRQAG